MKSRNVKVLIVEHSLPYYHVPVWAEVARHPAINLTVAFGRGFFTGAGGVLEGVVTEEMEFRTVVEPSIVRKIAGKTLLWHKAALDELKRTDYDVVIHQFETKILSLWPVKRIQKKRAGRFILWGIGESLKPTPLLDLLRKRLAVSTDAMVFYADSNRERYLSMGLDKRKLFVARNLIDIKPLRESCQSWNEERLQQFRVDQDLGKGPVLLSVGRLTERKRLDLLLEAAVKLRPHLPDLRVVIIGDGPVIEPLQRQVQEADLEDTVLFTGMISDEKKITPWFLAADLVVAPAQIGHLATHAHGYGVPLVTGDDRSLQGPEIEIMIPQVTGMTYAQNQVDSLVSVIRELLADEKRLNEMSIQATRRTDDFCGVEKTAQGFIEAVLHVTNLEGECEADNPES